MEREHRVIQVRKAAPAHRAALALRVRRALANKVQPAVRGLTVLRAEPGRRVGLAVRVLLVRGHRAPRVLREPTAVRVRTVPKVLLEQEHGAKPEVKVVQARREAPGVRVAPAVKVLTALRVRPE